MVKCPKLYYAVGGGLGHLQRGRSMMYTLAWQREEVLFLHSSPYASHLLEGIHHVCVPLEFNQKRETYQMWLLDFLNQHHFEEIYLDTFPLGIMGEWNGLRNHQINFYYVARYVKWAAYEVLIRRAIFFETVYQVECLNPKQTRFIQQNSNNIIDLSLKIPQQQLPEALAIFIKKQKNPIWLIVHSTPLSELQQLIDLAFNMKKQSQSSAQLWVITQEDISLKGITVFNNIVPHTLFEQVEKIFTACGFNSMLETKAFRHKHHFIPFERRFDDQFKRAKFARNKE